MSRPRSSIAWKVVIHSDWSWTINESNEICEIEGTEKDQELVPLGDFTDSSKKISMASTHLAGHPQLGWLMLEGDNQEAHWFSLSAVTKDSLRNSPPWFKTYYNKVDKDFAWTNKDSVEKLLSKYSALCLFSSAFLFCWVLHCIAQ